MIVIKSLQIQYIIKNHIDFSEATKQKISENVKKNSVCKLCKKECNGFRGKISFYLFAINPKTSTLKGKNTKPKGLWCIQRHWEISYLRIKTTNVEV